MRPQLTSYYAEKSETSDFGRWQEHIKSLSSDPIEWSEITRGLIIHNGLAALESLEYHADRYRDMGRRGVEDIVTGIFDIDPAPLENQRPRADRMIGYCYHFALLYCSLLRAKGIAARTRCGFASYFLADHWIDHWVVERWLVDHWVITDPNEGLDELTQDQFRSACTAWQICRSKQDDVQRYGNHEFWGWDELRGSLVNDLGALNKVELGDWGWCEAINVKHKDRPILGIDEDLDALAAMSVDEQHDELSVRYLADFRFQPQ